MEHSHKGSRCTGADRGFGLIEVMMGVVLSSVIAVSFVGLLVHSKRLSRTNGEGLRARAYLAEAIEAAKDLEASNWSALSSATCAYPSLCHPSLSGSAWSLSPGVESLDGGMILRSLTIHPVYRDQPSFPNQVSAAGTLDPDTLLIVASTTLNGSAGPRSFTLEAYVHSL